MNITEIKEIASRYGLAPNKKLGQNFLIDAGTRKKIIAAIEPGPEDSILEIGPGLGALTSSLIQEAGRVTAVEIDRGMSEYLRSRFASMEGFTLVHGDFLKIDLTGSFTKVVSNLPYYCASEILFRIVSDIPGADSFFVMLQQEMAERIVSQPGDGSYGALTIALNYYCLPRKLFRVPSGCFYPRPDVSSLFIRLDRKKQLPLGPERLALFHRLVRSAFWGRRKTLLTSLVRSPHLSYHRDALAAAIASLGLDPTVRGEELSLELFIALTELLYDIEGGNAGA